VLRRRKVEAHGDFILGPVSPKEYKDTVAELNESRTNRVFEFFKITPPERVGFAKHREAAEKKVAAVAAAEADAEETATSPRAAPQKTGRRSAPAATTAAAEGKARKKRGGRPADSPPSPKRTRVVDVETGLVEDVIAAVPLRAAAPSDVPSAMAGAGAAGPLLVPLSPKKKIVTMTTMFASCLPLGTRRASRALPPSAPKPHKKKMTPAPPPAARLTLPPMAPSSPPPLRPLLPRKTMSSPKRRKRRTRGPRAAAIG
jgi:hypothetical protein